MTVRFVLLGAAAAAALLGVQQLSAARPRDDRAWAHRIVLKITDLPAGWVAASGGKSTADCTRPSQAGITTTARRESPRFDRRDGAAVTSVARIVRTRAQARTLFARYVRFSYAPCFARMLRRELRDEGVAVRRVSSRALAVARLRDRAAGQRIAAQLGAAGGASFILYYDLLFLQRGRAVAVLPFYSAGFRLTSQFQNRLARKVAARMAG